MSVYIEIGKDYEKFIAILMAIRYHKGRIIQFDVDPSGVKISSVLGSGTIGLVALIRKGFFADFECDGEYTFRITVDRFIYLCSGQKVDFITISYSSNSDEDVRFRIRYEDCEEIIYRCQTYDLESKEDIVKYIKKDDSTSTSFFSFDAFKSLIMKVPLEFIGYNPESIEIRMVIDEDLFRIDQIRSRPTNSRFEDYQGWAIEVLTWHGYEVKPLLFEDIKTFAKILRDLSDKLICDKDSDRQSVRILFKRRSCGINGQVVIFLNISYNVDFYVVFSTKSTNEEGKKYYGKL